MSEQEKKRSFVEAEAQPMPRLFCVGRVAEVGECKATEKGTYLLQKIRVNPLGPGKIAFINFLFRPEWLRPGFDPNSMSTLKDGKSMLFVYRNNIAGKGTISVLKGLCGSQERFDALTEALFDLETVDETTVKELFQSFFIDEVDADEPPLVGYDMVQKKEKTDEINPKTGKPLKVLTADYEVGEWWFPTEKAKAGKVKTAQTAAAKMKEGDSPKYRVAFETDSEEDEVPF